MERKEEIKKVAEFQYEYIGSTDEKKAFKQGVLTGAEWADKNPNGSLIEWQTGEPKEFGDYLVSTTDGEVKMVGRIEFSRGWKWLGIEDNEVVAWCKLSNIKPYKEDKR